MRRTHLVTGATGFIGAALVLELLQRTDDVIVAIVRPGERPAEERLRAALAGAADAYGVGPAVVGASGRCRAIAGDVLQPACGVRDAVDGRVAQIWHCAASLRYENRYRDEIHATNVDGTRHALALAERLEVESFNYISTAYVAGTTSGVIPEALSGSVDTNNHYERSKVDAEHLVDAATGFRKRILRPGIVMGHSRTRAATTFTGFYGFLRQLVQFRGMLERAQAGLVERKPLRVRVDEGAGVNLAPIDTVAEEIVRIGLSDESEGIYHVTHPSPPALGLVVRTMFRAVGLHDPVFVPNKDEFDWLDKRFDQRVDFYGSYLIGDKRFERLRSDAALRGRRDPAVSFDAATIDAFARWYLARLEQERVHLPAAR